LRTELQDERGFHDARAVIRRRLANTAIYVATMSHRAAANSGERLKNLANFCDMNATCL
jgi:hypothetical protein